MIKDAVKSDRIELVVIASSFGGVEANTLLLSHLPASISPAIILLTHLTENSETIYAEVLENSTGHPISIAQEKKNHSTGTYLSGTWRLSFIN